MQAILDTILENPIYLILSIALIILIVYSVVKKLFKLALVVSIGLLIYLGYIYYQGGEDGLKKTKDSLIKKAKDTKDNLLKKAEETKDGFIEDVKEGAIEKVKDEAIKIKDKAQQKAEESL